MRRHLAAAAAGAGKGKAEILLVRILLMAEMLMRRLLQGGRCPPGSSAISAPRLHPCSSASPPPVPVRVS